MANAHKAGGGVACGAGTQEENMYRGSDAVRFTEEQPFVQAAVLLRFFCLHEAASPRGVVCHDYNRPCHVSNDHNEKHI